MKIAMTQIPMSLTIEGNMSSILQGLAEAKGLGADVAVFPECAVTGYHRDMGKEISRPRIDEVLTRIGGRCAELGISTIGGAPYYGSENQERPWNAALVFDSSGKLTEVFPKIIFTAGEVRHGIFEPGVGESRRSFELGGRTSAILICVEFDGQEGQNRTQHCSDLLGRMVPKPSLVFVIGVLDLGPNSHAAAFAKEAAQKFEAHFVIVNAAEWGGGAPEGCLGRSVVITPNGEVLCEAPWNQAGVTLAEVT
jgi:predicted amidohydrolase